MVVPHLRRPSANLWIETALCSAITHNDTASISSCVAFVAMLWDLLGRNEPPKPSWWVERFVEVAEELETVPTVLYILMCHGQDAETAIIRAVNDTRDNDTVAAIVGAAVGALHGREALADRWLDKLTGRTQAADDGRVLELIEEARQRWWEDLSIVLA